MTMRSNKINYLWVGVFVAGSIAAMVVSLSLLMGRTGATDGYHAVFENVAGLKRGSKVIYQGYLVGQVTEVSPSFEGSKASFRIDFGVQDGWRIPVDSTVKIASPSLLESPGLVITAGVSPDVLEEGAPVTSVRTPDLFGVVSGAAEKLTSLADEGVGPLLAKFSRGLDNVNRLLEGEAGMLAQDAVLLVGDMRALLDDLLVTVPGITSDLERAVSDVRSVTTQVRRLSMPENVSRIEASLAGLEASVESANRALATAEEMLTNANSLVEDGGEDAKKSLKETRYIVESVARHIDSINQNVEGMSLNLLEFSRQIRASPGLLLTSDPIDDEAALGAAR